MISPLPIRPVLLLFPALFRDERRLHFTIFLCVFVTRRRKASDGTSMSPVLRAARFSSRFFSDMASRLPASAIYEISLIHSVSLTRLTYNRLFDEKGWTCHDKKRGERKKSKLVNLYSCRSCLHIGFESGSQFAFH